MVVSFIHCRWLIYLDWHKRTYKKWCLLYWKLYQINASEQVLVAQLCPTLCDPVECSLPSYSVHGILQARILEWISIPFSRVSSRHRNWTQVSHTTGRFFTAWATGKGIFPAQGSNSVLCHCRWTFYKLSHQGSPQINMLHSKDFPGGPVAKILNSQCRGTGFHPCSGN